MTSKTYALESNSLRSGLCIDIPSTSSLFSSERIDACYESQNSKEITSPIYTPSQSQFKLDPKASEDHMSVLEDTSITEPQLSLRSHTGMQGLLLAEAGGGLVELDPFGGGSGFKQGTTLFPGLVTPQGGVSDGVSCPPSAPDIKNKKGRLRSGNIRRLNRQGTLLSHNVTPARNAAELRSLLGNSRAKIKSGAKLLPPVSSTQHGKNTVVDTPIVSLEQGKSRARVELDLQLDSEVFVEGGYVTGKILVKVRRTRAKENLILIGGGKLRVVGFEGIPGNDERHTFYQHSASLFTITALSHVLYSSAPDAEGYAEAIEGLHTIPFAMKLPVNDQGHTGAKGPFDNHYGIVVKYIAIVSFKLKDPVTSKCSITHFYRSCEIFPYFNSWSILAPVHHQLLSTTSRGVLLGGPGKIKLSASLHRNIWVAGQKCCVAISVDNDTRKHVKSLTLRLIRTITIFRPQPHLDASPTCPDQDACQTTTIRKLISESTLESGQRGLRGHVTEKGWWVGVDPNMQTKFNHFILLPHDTLSIVRSRLLEVNYAIRISLIVGSLSSEVSVMLPLRIVSHLSIDPPPSFPTPFDHPGVCAPVKPLPIPDYGPAFLTSQALPSLSGTGNDQNGAVPEASRVVSTKECEDDTARAMHVDALEATASADPTSSPEESPLLRISYLMPRTSEENSDRDGASPQNSLLGSQTYSLADEFDDRSLSNPTQTDDLGDRYLNRHRKESTRGDNSSTRLTEDLLGKLELMGSGEALNLEVGSARLAQCDDGHGSRFTEIAIKSETEATVSAKKSQVYRSYASPEWTPSRLPRNQAPQKKLIPIPTSPTHVRSRTSDTSTPSSLSPASSVDGTSPRVSPCKPTPSLRSTVSLRARIASSSGQTTSSGAWQTRPPFSQRVDRLAAASRVTIPSKQSTVTSAVNEDTSDLDLCTEQKAPDPSSTRSLSESSPILSGRKSYFLSSPLRLSHTSRLTIGIPNRFPVSGSVSGSVRSRIAELEGRVAGTAVAADGPQCGGMPGHAV